MNVERNLTVADIYALLMKHWRKVVRFSIASFVILFFSILFFAEPHYRAEATFRQAQSSSEETASLQFVLKAMQSRGEESSSISVMRSKPLLGKVVEEMGLQAVFPRPSLLSRIGKLLLREGGGFVENCGLQLRDVKYEGAKAKKLLLKKGEEGNWELYSPRKKLLGSIELDKPFQVEGIKLTLIQMPKRGKRFTFRLLPKRRAVKQLSKRLKIKVSRLDPSILKLSYKASERNVAIGTLNGVMEHLQKYLFTQHEKFAEAQIAYLQKRKSELARDFEGALTEQVAYLEDSMANQGYLNLAQEVEMLSEPKERFLAQRHRLDIEAKKWKKESLFASIQHPWKEGLTRREALDMKKSLVEPIPSELIAEYEGVDLETVQSLYTEYSRERERLIAEKKQLESYKEKVVLPEFCVSALSHLLKDPASQRVIQKGVDLRLEIGDRENRSEKERTRLQETLKKQKEFLAQHLKQKADVVRASLKEREGKIAALQFAALQLIEKERRIIDEKLGEIAGQMGELPERWKRESELKIQKELALQVIEGLTKLSESKVVDHHLFHVESKPLEKGDAPLSIEPPRLFLYASLGGLVGGFASLFFLIVQASLTGLPLNRAALRQLGYSAFDLNEETIERSLAKVAIEIEKDPVIALIGGGYGKKLASYLQAIGKKVHFVEVGENAPAQTISSKLSSWKSEWDCILLSVQGNLESPEAMICGKISDRSILVITNETPECLSFYPREKTLCLLKR